VVTSYSLLTCTAGGTLLEPCFFPRHLTGVLYCDFLRNVLPVPLQDVDLQCVVHVWSTYHDVDPHFLLALREFLKKTCSLNNGCDKVDQQHGQLVPLGAAKLYVFAAEIRDVQGLEQRVDSGFEMICSTRGFFRKVRPSLFLHETSCVEVQSGHFGHFIHSSGGSNLETMPQNTYIRTTYFSCIVV
jgi:hypothetical protein